MPHSPSAADSARRGRQPSGLQRSERCAKLLSAGGRGRGQRVGGRQGGALLSAGPYHLLAKQDAVVLLLGCSEVSGWQLRARHGGSVAAR